MNGVKISSTEPFVYSIFGVQLQSTQPDARQQSLISTFDDLISRAKHVDKITQTSYPTLSSSSSTQLWLAYWATRNEYEKWWNSPSVQDFWTSLPPDAGMFREILTIPGSRTQFATNINDPIGLGHVFGSENYFSVLDKSGYWGCYRHRIPEMQASPENRFRTSLDTSTLPVSRSSGEMRPGRVRVSKIPENMLFVVEGQDHSNLSPKEREYWFNHFDENATKWMTGLFSTTPQEGLLDARMCYVPHSGHFQDIHGKQTNTGPLGYNRKMQLLYFTDFAAMLRTGMQNQAHIHLRKGFLEAYGPGGDLGGDDARVCLWVETSLLRPDDVECEYVGCRDGTGLMQFAE